MSHRPASGAPYPQFDTMPDGRVAISAPLSPDPKLILAEGLWH